MAQSEDDQDRSGPDVGSNPKTQGLIEGSIVAFDHPCSVHQIIVPDQATKSILSWCSVLVVESSWSSFLLSKISKAHCFLKLLGLSQNGYGLVV